MEEAPIMYRVWDKERKEMNYPPKKFPTGSDHPNNDAGYFLLNQKGTLFCNDGIVLDNWNESYVVMLCSGLKDKKGKYIYAGDFYSPGNVVEFSYGSFNINGDVPLNAICSKIEIIGNIYQNKKKKK